MLKELFARCQSVWDFLRTCGKPIVLYGMGDGADKVLAAFEKLDIRADAVMASDEFVRGQQFHSFTVQRLSDIEYRYDDFIVALCFASQLPEVMETIKAVARKHTTVVPSVPVFGDVLFDDDFVSAHLNEMEQAYSLMADELSRRVFAAVAEFYYTGKPDGLRRIAFSLTSGLGCFFYILFFAAKTKSPSAFRQTGTQNQTGPNGLRLSSLLHFRFRQKRIQLSEYLTYPHCSGFTVTDSRGLAPHSSCRSGRRKTVIIWNFLYLTGKCRLCQFT